MLPGDVSKHRSTLWSVRCSIGRHHLSSGFTEQKTDKTVLDRELIRRIGAVAHSGTPRGDEKGQQQHRQHSNFIKRKKPDKAMPNSMCVTSKRRDECVVTGVKEVASGVGLMGHRNAPCLFFLMFF